MAYGTSNKYIVYSINTQQIVNDTNTNATWLKVWVDVWRTNSGYETYGNGTVYCRINGTVYSAAISTAQRITSSPIRVGEWDVTIPHQPDGTASISITAWFSHARFSSSEQGFVLPLNTIPRAANITNFQCSTSYLNGAMTVTYDSKATFTYYLRLSIPNVQQIYRASLGNQSAGSKTASHTFTSSELSTIYNLTKTSDKQQIGAVIETYNGGNKVGESSESILTLTLPTTIVPTLTSLTAAGVDLFNSQYIQGKSKVKLTANGAAGVYGSTITGYSFLESNNDFSSSGNSNTCTTDVINKSGTVTYKVVVTDSRGRTATKSVSIKVLAYSAPTLNVDAYRCKSDGTMDVAEGNYIAVKATYTYTNISGNSITSRSIKIDGTSKSTNFASGTIYKYGTYSLDSEHTVVVSVKDAINSSPVEITRIIDIGSVIADFQKDRIGFGRFCTEADQMQVGYTLNLFNGLKVNDENQPTFVLVRTLDVEI